MKPTIYVVTKNRGKILEIQNILAPLGIEAKSIYEVESLEDIEEAGETYVENALLKARSGFEKTGLICVGEDSGLEVDALGGLPGVHSARFGGPGLSSPERIELLLQHLQGISREKRTARFVCVVALVWSQGEEIFEGICEGLIAEEPRGNQGFGYDPVFIFPPFEKTFAQLGPRVKNRVSHRAIAFRKCAHFLLEKVLKTPWRQEAFEGFPHTPQGPEV